MKKLMKRMAKQIHDLQEQQAKPSTCTCQCTCKTAASVQHPVTYTQPSTQSGATCTATTEHKVARSSSTPTRSSFISTPNHFSFEDTQSLDESLRVFSQLSQFPPQPFQPPLESLQYTCTSQSFQTSPQSFQYTSQSSQFPPQSFIPSPQSFQYTSQSFQPRPESLQFPPQPFQLPPESLQPASMQSSQIPPQSFQSTPESLQPASMQSKSQKPPTGTKYFSASAINRSNLKDAHQVIAANKKLCVPARASTLAVKLAREAVFGDETLAMCTVAGERGGFMALPVEEMKVLKTTMLHLFSAVTPVEFETIWKECNDAIGQACKRARDKLKK